MSGILDWIERVGNKLPNPYFIFIWLCLIVAVVSALVAMTGATTINPRNGDEIPIRSLLSGEGLKYIISSFIPNFVNFRPLGLVLVMIISIGVLEGSGLLQALFKSMMKVVPSALLIPATFLFGIMGNVTSDAAVIVIPPLAGILFATAGLNPIVGIVVAFTGATAGFSANILIAGTDALLSGITTQAAQLVAPGTEVTPLGNWYFMATTTLILPIAGFFAIKYFVAPSLEKLPLDLSSIEESKESLNLESAGQKRGLYAVLIVTILYVGALWLAFLPENSWLRAKPGGSFTTSLLIRQIVPFLFVYFILIGYVYGRFAKTINSKEEAVDKMVESAKRFAPTLILFLIAAQFIAWFGWTNLGYFVAENGANFLKDLNMSNYVLAVIFILITTLINLFVLSGSAQWALMAPVFVPIFMQLGFSPAATQAMFRIGDSSSNIMSPMNVYLPVCLAYINIYNKDLRVGTFIRAVFPVFLTFITVWTILFLIWMAFGLPVGVGHDLYIK